MNNEKIERAVPNSSANGKFHEISSLRNFQKVSSGMKSLRRQSDKLGPSSTDDMAFHSDKSTPDLGSEFANIHSGDSSFSTTTSIDEFSIRRKESAFTRKFQRQKRLIIKFERKCAQRTIEKCSQKKRHLPRGLNPRVKDPKAILSLSHVNVSKNPKLTAKGMISRQLPPLRETLRRLRKGRAAANCGDSESRNNTQRTADFGQRKKMLIARAFFFLKLCGDFVSFRITPTYYPETIFSFSSGEIYGEASSMSVATSGLASEHEKFYTCFDTPFIHVVRHCQANFQRTSPNQGSKGAHLRNFFVELQKEESEKYPASDEILESESKYSESNEEELLSKLFVHQTHDQEFFPSDTSSKCGALDAAGSCNCQVTWNQARNFVNNPTKSELHTTSYIIHTLFKTFPDVLQKLKQNPYLNPGSHCDSISSKPERSISLSGITSESIVDKNSISTFDVVELYRAFKKRSIQSIFGFAAQATSSTVFQDQMPSPKNAAEFKNIKGVENEAEIRSLETFPSFQNNGEYKPPALPVSWSFFLWTRRELAKDSSSASLWEKLQMDTNFEWRKILTDLENGDDFFVTREAKNEFQLLPNSDRFLLKQRNKVGIINESKNFRRTRVSFNLDVSEISCVARTNVSCLKFDRRASFRKSPTQSTDFSTFTSSSLELDEASRCELDLILWGYITECDRVVLGIKKDSTSKDLQICSDQFVISGEFVPNHYIDVAEIELLKYRLHFTEIRNSSTANLNLLSGVGESLALQIDFIASSTVSNSSLIYLESKVQTLLEIVLLSKKSLHQLQLAIKLVCNSSSDYIETLWNIVSKASQARSEIGQSFNKFLQICARQNEDPPHSFDHSKYWAFYRKSRSLVREEMQYKCESFNCLIKFLQKGLDIVSRVQDDLENRLRYIIGGVDKLKCGWELGFAQQKKDRNFGNLGMKSE